MGEMVAPAEIRILHVDDEPGLAAVTTDFLEREDDRFTVDTAACAAEGLERIAETEFDCIVSDYDMPGRNGIEFLRAVREDHPDLPFILFTGKGSEEVASDAISAGVTDYLQKESGTDQYAVLANRIVNVVTQAHVERELREQKQRFQILFDRLTQATVEVEYVDGEPVVQEVNPAFVDVFGYDVDEIVGSSLDDYLVPDDSTEEATRINQHVRSGGGLDSMEVTRRTADGQREFLLQNAVYDDGDGGFAIYTDITERKKRRERYEAFLEQSSDIITVLDPDGTYQYQSQSSARILGYEPEELVGEDAFEYVHPDDRVVMMEQFQEGLANPELTPTAEYRFRHADGSWVWLESIGNNQLDNPGIEGFIINTREITERREREQSLERLQDRTQDLMHTATEEETAEIAVETAQEVVDAQLVGCHLLSEDRQLLEPAAVVDTVRDELGDPPSYGRTADDPAAAVVWEGFERGEPMVIEDTRDRGTLAEVTPARSVLLHPLDGYGMFIVSSTEPEAFDAADRTLVDIVATSLAVALERVERERTLERQNERLDQFASVVSHDLYNPLNVAQGRLGLARSGRDSEHLEVAAEAVDRGISLIDDLLTLAREGVAVGEVERVDLAATADSCWGSVDTEAATLVVETEQSIRADRSRVKQLLENLIRNAVEHGGDQVTVTVGDLADGFYVADDGPGVPADDREVVFEATYSTTEDGTGFGLKIVEEIAQAHGWAVDVTESAAGGARFEITGVESGSE